MGDRHSIVIGPLWAFSIVATLVVAARFYVRRKFGGLYWDDWLMLVAIILQLIDMGFISKSSYEGLGKHDRDMTTEQLIQAGKWGWLFMIPGTFVAVLARISSGIFLVRVFGIYMWFKVYIMVFTALQAIAGILVLFTNFLAITPVEALWNPYVKNKKIRYSPDVASNTAYVCQGLFTVADLTYVLFPVIIVWNLQLSQKKKIALILLLCTSLCTVAASIMKAIYVSHVEGVSEPAYTSSLSALWSGLEQAFVIIMASMPALAAMRKLNPHPRHWNKSSPTNSSGPSEGRFGKRSSQLPTSADSTATVIQPNTNIDFEQFSTLSNYLNREGHRSHIVGKPTGLAVAYHEQSNDSSHPREGGPRQIRRTDEDAVEFTRYGQWN